MGIAAALFERRTTASGDYNDGGTLTNPASWLVSLISGGPGGKTVAGVPMNEQIAECINAIYATTHVISEITGHVPLKLFRVLEKGKQPDPAHALYVILHDLWTPELTAVQGKEMMTRHLALWGRTYAQIQRDRRGNIVGLWPLHPQRMFVDRDELNRKRFRYYMGRGDYQTFIHDPDKPPILHLHINTDDGLDGRSPVVLNKESLGITKAAEEYVAAWFGNGAIPGVIATHPGKLTRTARENIRRGWLERFMGAKNANKFALLEEGIKIDVVGVDPQKSQLDELRNTQLANAARIYRVPLFLIQNQTKDTSWGSGIEQQMLGFVNLTMMFWFECWTQAIARDLLTRKSFNTHQALFVINALVKGDIERRYAAYAQGRQNGWLNADEIRELEDLNPIDGGAGQVFWMPANMQAADAAARVEPDPAPPAQPDDAAVSTP